MLGEQIASGFGSIVTVIDILGQRFEKLFAQAERITRQEQARSESESAEAGRVRDDLAKALIRIDGLREEAADTAAVMRRMTEEVAEAERAASTARAAADAAEIRVQQEIGKRALALFDYQANLGAKLKPDFDQISDTLDESKLTPGFAKFAWSLLQSIRAHLAGANIPPPPK